MNCKDPKTKIQHPRGECPICKCTCSFVFDLKRHDSIFAAVEYKKKAKKGHSPTNRAAAKDYLVQAAKAGTIIRTKASSSLGRQQEEGLLQSTDDEISRQSANLGHHAHAAFIANNPPSLQASHHLKRQIKIAQHPNGAVFANLRGNLTQPINTRSYSKSTAAQQCRRNTGLYALQNPVSSVSIESVNSTMSTSSSSITSIKKCQHITTPTRTSTTTTSALADPSKC